ncbi:hypothetical protein BO71DRAFT_411247 [Aspergillus ellipticus CBS 707.79]|uniref:GPI anchored serine-threonine rich protein n=1 Tax=Aspergillus ellipticus CBS 707.79 TaxID=1448320 RepID=A0A319DCV0_9EURO|nr:hypothetical protein BO71DRAFT_411247 [Aspergillus ellipticus CBS 707.79]
MHFLSLFQLVFTATLAVTVAAAGAAAAATDNSPAPTSAYNQCAKNILDACLNIINPQLKNCEANDWKCLCDQSTSVLTCYNDCPSDSRHSAAADQKLQYCNAAAAYSLYSTVTSSTTAAKTTAAATKTAAQASHTSAAATQSSGAAAAGLET